MTDADPSDSADEEAFSRKQAGMYIAEQVRLLQQDEFSADSPDQIEKSTGRIRKDCPNVGSEVRDHLPSASFNLVLMPRCALVPGSLFGLFELPALARLQQRFRLRQARPQPGGGGQEGKHGQQGKYYLLLAKRNPPFFLSIF